MYNRALAVSICIFQLKYYQKMMLEIGVIGQRVKSTMSAFRFFGWGASRISKENNKLLPEI